ncbi:MAG: hypothetical protein RLZZ427_1426 [Pseudomonadota bacterium]
MLNLIEANGPALALAVVLVLLVGWWLLRRGSSAPRRERRPDVLDEGVAPAQRNQALIDAPAVAVVPPPAAGAMAGIGEIIAVAAQDELEQAAAAPTASVAPADPAVPAAPAASAPAAGDDLSRIKGLGPKLRALLPTLGITTFAQIAALSEADLDALDAQLGTFAGRPRRDNWVAQAKFLAAGDSAGFEGQFGKL